MKNLNKIRQSIFKGLIKPEIFLILFVSFFSSLAFAAALTVTFVGALIPGGNNNTPTNNDPRQQCRGNDASNSLLTFDRTTTPSDITFNEDGSFVYTSNAQTGGMQSNTISQNKLLDNYQILSDAIRAGTYNCDHLKGTAPQTLSGGQLNTKTHDIDIYQNGKLFFIIDDAQNLGKFTASTPYDVNTLTFEQKLDLNGGENSVEFHRDGTKIFALDQTASSPTIATYALPGPYDISSKTQIHKVDLYDLDIEDVTDKHEYGQDIEFNSNGSAMFILISNADKEQEYIYHFDLTTNYDISTAVKAGRFHVGAIFMNRNSNSRFGDPSGFGFSRDGMNLYLLDNVGGKGVHQINQFKLECPYGLVKCSSDSTSTIGAQVELAKQNITQNVSVIFKRFEWIKRNRDQEDLTSHNINLNYPNPLLEALAMKLESPAKKTLVNLVSLKEKKKKKSKWSSWSIGDLYVGDFDKHGFEAPKMLVSRGLTFGADRKFGDNKFFGWALRYGHQNSDQKASVQKTDMDSFTLNFYGIIPRNNSRYINAVLGFSSLHFDNFYDKKLSSERHGKQVFTAINYRTKNTYGKLNITPSGKFTYGITKLSDYTDFISKTIDGPVTDIRYEEDSFESGELTAGFLFDLEKIEYDNGTFQPMGAVEYVYNVTPGNDFKYSLQGSSTVNEETILGKYSKESLKTNIGFEMIYSNGFTISPMYERIFSLTRESEKVFSERLTIKLSRSKEENNTEFALNFDPISQSNGDSRLTFAKKIQNFYFKLNSNFGLKDQVNYLTNFEVSGQF